MPFVKDDAYRSRMEAFVTGLNGSSTLETVFCMTTLPICILLHRAILGLLFATGLTPSPRTWPLTARFAWEFAVLVLPTLATMTVLGDHCFFVNGGLLLVALAVHIAAASAAKKWPARLSLAQVATPPADSGSSFLGFVSSFRSGMMLSTCIAILAVDFPVFPRRFAKTETYGVSMMDLGVGSFVLASALVSRQTRRGAGSAATAKPAPAALSHGRKIAPSLAAATPELNGAPLSGTEQRHGGHRARSRGALAPSPPSRSSSGRRRSPSVSSRAPQRATPMRKIRSTTRLAAATSSSKPPRAALRELVSTLTSLSPLIIMGSLKLILHSAVNYQVHVSEYGVHWNFFFTLCAVAVFAALLEQASRALASQGAAHPSASAMMYLLGGLAMGAAYEVGLRQAPPTWLVSAGELAATAALRDAQAGAPSLATPPAAPTVSLQEYILYAGRPEGSFFSQNREGIAGMWGFFALYLCGIGLGKLLLHPSRRGPEAWWAFVPWFTALCTALWLALAVVQQLVGPVSRRLVNLPYVILVAAFCATMLLLVLVAESVGCATAAGTGSGQKQTKQGAATESESRVLPPLLGRLFSKPVPLPQATLDSGSLILDSMNVNFLAIFVVANLCVGLANGLFHTLDCSAPLALLVLGVYIGAVAGFAVLMRAYGVALKVW